MEYNVKVQRKLNFFIWKRKLFKARKIFIKKEDWILLIRERKNKNFRQNKICFSR